MFSKPTLTKAESVIGKGARVVVVVAFSHHHCPLFDAERNHALPHDGLLSISDGRVGPEIARCMNDGHDDLLPHHQTTRKRQIVLLTE